MNPRVLYIEDNEQNLYLVTFILEAKGYEVFQARSGEEGLRLAKQCDPEIILLDIQLPEMDGYEIANRLRRNPGLAKIPLVAVTSYAMAGDRDKALASGCDGYIEKPINPETFVAQIEQYLREKDA